MTFSIYSQRINQLVESALLCHGQDCLLETQWLAKFAKQLNQVKQSGGTVWVVGNGGSASIASHLVVDLVNMHQITALTLHESALLTCFSNDYGYERAFAKMLETMAKPTDMLVAISSSGSSDNIVEAVKVMQTKGGQVLSVTGFSKDNQVRQLTQSESNFSIWVNSEQYGEVETAHQLILHALVDHL